MTAANMKVHLPSLSTFSSSFRLSLFTLTFVLPSTSDMDDHFMTIDSETLSSMSSAGALVEGPEAILLAGASFLSGLAVASSSRERFERLVFIFERLGSTGDEAKLGKGLRNPTIRLWTVESITRFSKLLPELV